MKLIVEGMTCGHCVGEITKAIRAIEPTAQVAVDLAAKAVAVAGAVDVESVKAAIEAEGYKVIATEGAEQALAEQVPACCGSCHA